MKHNHQNNTPITTAGGHKEALTNLGIMKIYKKHYTFEVIK